LDSGWEGALKGQYQEIFYLFAEKNNADVVIYICSFLLLYDATQQHFLALWHTMEKVSFRCEIQQKRFSSIVEYNEGSFPLLWDTTGRFFPSFLDITTKQYQGV
jgi:hypothetical protein